MPDIQRNALHMRLQWSLTTACKDSPVSVSILGCKQQKLAHCHRERRFIGRVLGASRSVRWVEDKALKRVGTQGAQRVRWAVVSLLEMLRSICSFAALINW